MRALYLPRALALAFLPLLACGPLVSLDGDGDGNGTPSIPPTETGPSAPLIVGEDAIVVADFLNLRQAAGTDANILIAMPCGAPVAVVDGPSTNPAGWWEVQYVDPTDLAWSGWASGKYLTLPQNYVYGTCGTDYTATDSSTTYDFAGVDFAGVPIAPDAGAPSTIVQQMFARAQLGVGYSYWWGHGAWRSDGLDPGTCSGDCPDCTHTDVYGADCSGFVAKVWQVPGSSALADDEHPYSTDDFYNSTTDQWTQIDRSDLQPGDAMVYRSGDEGHIVLVQSVDDPYGSIWLYEARGCATGIVNDNHTVDSSYRAIRRNGI